MIIFKLTMPGVGSWDGNWSGSRNVYCVSRINSQVPKDIVGKDFTYDFGDGWRANISVQKCEAADANKIMKHSKGFMGYYWMIESLIKDKYIHT